MLPLTNENIAIVFERGVLTKGKHVTFGRWLGIPEEHHHSPHTAADWWMSNGQDRSWRCIIYFLDRVGETRDATDLMPYSEPPSGVLHI